MFGADQNNYGVTYGFESFQEHWSCNGFKFTEAELTENVEKNDICPVAFVDPSCSPSKATPCECLFPCEHVQSMPNPPAKWASFIVWGLNLVTAGMMIGALTLAPVLSKCFGRKMTISIGGLTCVFLPTAFWREHLFPKLAVCRHTAFVLDVGLFSHRSPSSCLRRCPEHSDSRIENKK